MNILDLTHELRSLVPKDYFYRPIGKKEFRKILEAINAVESLTEKYGITVLNENHKSFVDPVLLERQIVITRLKVDKTLNESLKKTAIDHLESGMLVEGVGDVVTSIKDWLSVAVGEAKTVILTFAKAMGGFGVALIRFLKRILTDVNLKAAWVMIKDAEFVSIAKSLGNWLIRRITDFTALYRSLFAALHEGIFSNLAGTSVVVALRNWVQANAQDYLDKIIHPDTGNPEIRKIITEKYLDNALEEISKKYEIQINSLNVDQMHEAWKKAWISSTNDEEILKLTIRDKGFLATYAGKALMVGIGALLAWLYWEVWLYISFIGDLEYDYSFEQAYMGLKGDFNIAEWYLSNDGGFQTMLIMLSTKMGMPSIGISHTPTNIAIAAVLTVILVWKRSKTEQWNKIKDSEFFKKVEASYEESKQAINGQVQGNMGDFYSKIQDILNMQVSKLYLKPSGITLPKSSD